MSLRLNQKGVTHMARALVAWCPSGHVSSPDCSQSASRPAQQSGTHGARTRLPSRHWHQTAAGCVRPDAAAVAKAKAHGKRCRMPMPTEPKQSRQAAR